MPLKNVSRTKKRPDQEVHQAFWPLVLLMFVIWVLYRSLFRFPVWFDELIGKAIFFGLPVWLYVSITQEKKVVETLFPDKVNKGLFLGLAIGGVYGFAGSLLGILRAGGGVQAVFLFSSLTFWWEFFLALMTSFWETLFFFSWITTVIFEKYKKSSLVWQVSVAALIFMFFHIPNSILRFSGGVVAGQVFLMLLFGLGQALIFYRWRNFYTLVLSHTIWGMVLLVHFL